MVAAPPPTGPAVSSPALCRPLPLPQPGPVVSEGLRPSLPSPTSSVATFGESGREEMKSDKEREKERARAVKERARAEKERARAAKERAHADKERARREAKEREREHRLIKTQHRKGAKKENGAKDGSATPGSTPAEPNSSSTILKDGYF
ncbi:hypothetical protein scyTo_0024283 [Scyliorhinus torazame]|uniref:Uncharacterized protein n=1 Tax=Scyliorhinus torazame TaxID=75743 RepID=A0A401QDY1_SCYTO|nr:hypothetical protein [Scyliorhinus torazame]